MRVVAILFNKLGIDARVPDGSVTLDKHTNGNILEYLGTLWNTLQYAGIPWSILEYLRILWNTLDSLDRYSWLSVIWLSSFLFVT